MCHDVFMTGELTPREEYLLATSPAVEERRRRAADLRRVGVPWPEVAKQCGYGNGASAARDVLAALARERRVTAAHAAGVIQLELEKLDLMESRLWRVLGRKHVTIQNGRVVLDPQTGELIPDDMPALSAIDRLLKVQERRARLIGLDAVTKVDVEVRDEMSSRIRELMAELGRPVIEGELVDPESDAS